MTLRRIGLVAWHVFRESVRHRVQFAIAVFALLLVATGLVIGQLSAGEDLKVIKDLGLATMELAGVLMTVVLGVGVLSVEVESRSIFSLLAKPLARSELVVGKYLGLVFTVLVNVAAMTATLYIVLACLDWQALPVDRRGWETPPTDPRLLLAVTMISAELTLLTAVVLFFSTFSSSPILSVIFTVGLFIVGLLSEDLRGFGHVVDVSPALARCVSIIGWVVPAFSAFDIKAQIVHGMALPPGFVAYTLVYATVYIAALLMAAVAVFSRRDFR